MSEKLFTAQTTLLIIRMVLIYDCAAMSNSLSLADLLPGDSGIIARLKVDEALYQRLSAMGLRIGRPIRVIRQAAMSGPIQVRVGFTDLILRRVDALNICVSRTA